MPVARCRPIWSEAVEGLGHHRDRSAGGVADAHENEAPLAGRVGIEHVELAVRQAPDRVDIDAGERLDVGGQGVKEVAGPHQPRFLTRHHRKNHRPRARRFGRHGARQFEHHGDSGSVVIGPGVNPTLVALADIRPAPAEVVEMGHDQNRLVVQLRIAAGDGRHEVHGQLHLALRLTARPGPALTETVVAAGLEARPR